MHGRFKKITFPTQRGFPGGSDGKESTCNVWDPGLTSGSGKCPGEGNGYPLQYSCLENPMDGGAWQATVHGVSKSQTQLSDFTFTFTQLSLWPEIRNPCMYTLSSQFLWLPGNMSYGGKAYISTQPFSHLWPCDLWQISGPQPHSYKTRVVKLLYSNKN